MITNTYSFEYSSAYNEDLFQYPAKTSVAKTVAIDQDASWPMVLREFAQFLSAVYGYDVAEKLYIKLPGWTDEAEYVSLNEYE